MRTELKKMDILLAKGNIPKPESNLPSSESRRDDYDRDRYDRGEIGIVIEHREVAEDLEAVRVITEEEEVPEGLTDINPMALYPFCLQIGCCV